MRYLYSFLLVTMFVSLSGCFTQKYIGSSLDKQTMMSGAGAEKKEFTVVKHFKESSRDGWIIIGLIPVKTVDIPKIINMGIMEAGGDAAINLKIETQYDVIDVFIGIIVGGIYNSRISEIQFDVIKYK